MAPSAMMVSLMLAVLLAGAGVQYDVTRWHGRGQHGVHTPGTAERPPDQPDTIRHCAATKGGYMGVLT